MRNLRIAERIFNTPLMITEDKLNVILKVVGPRFELDTSGLPALEAVSVSDDERRRSGYEVVSGVAIIGIHGPLLHRVLASEWPSGGPTSYADIRRGFDTAMADDDVQQIVFDIDSPGGEVNGAFDLADHIYNSRGTKKITAIVNESAYSAAYLIASAADRIEIPRTGGAGSVGVIATHIDQSGFNEKNGFSVTHIIAGAKKADFSPHAELSDSALINMQEMVDGTYEMFVDTVARNRGMSKQAVRETEAGIYVGKKAVAAGLADAVAPVDKTMANLVKRKGGRQMPAQKTEVEDPKQSAATIDPETAVIPAAAVAKTYSQEALDAAVSVGIKQASADATAGERSRILAVSAACQANQAGAMFARLVEDGCDEKQANGRILDALAMRNADNDVSSLHGGSTPKEEGAVEINSSDIYASRTGKPAVS